MRKTPEELETEKVPIIPNPRAPTVGELKTIWTDVLSKPPPPLPKK